MFRTTTTTIATILAFAAPAAIAQDDATLNLADSEEYGQYLTGPGGLPVYMFTTDTQGNGGAPAISCAGDCLDAWPLVTVEGEATAGGGVDETLVGTMDHDGHTVATYNGWPLYTYAEDAAGEPPQGQDIHSFGGEWYLLGADGEKIEEE